MLCNLGGGVVRRHNAIRDTLRDWMNSQKRHTTIEQHVPKWDRTDDRAILDLAYTEPTGDQVYMDVSVVAAAIRNSDGDGKPLARRERTKHSRYPGSGMVPFVVDVRGRWGKEAQAWLRGVLKNYGVTERATAVLECRHMVSQALQVAVAEQCLRSSLSRGANP
jgi:hypothetical protein